MNPLKSCSCWIVTVVVVLVCMPLGVFAQQTRLPEEALKRAREAEQLLKNNNARGAVALLEKLNQDHPGHAAVNLRLAQILDATGEYGPALFYYRRYVQIAGSKALEDMKSRTYTLEMMAGVPKAAEAFATKSGAVSTPVPTPAPKQALGKVNKDGTVSYIRSAEELKAALDQAGIKPSPQSANALPATVEPTPEQTPDQPVATPPVAQASPPGTRKAPRGKFTPPPISNDPVPTETPAASTESSRGPVQITQEPAHQPARSAEPARPTPQPTIQPSGFFVQKEIGGDKTVIRIMNQIPESTMTFNLVPEGEVQPINVILASNEQRSIQVAPGRFHIVIHITNTNYPPATIYEREFEEEFAAGVQYAKAFQVKAGEIR